MSTNRESSKAAQIDALLRRAAAAEKAARWAEVVGLLREVAGLDPGDWRTLHRLGDIHRVQLGRFREAAAFYAREARAFEGDGFEVRAIAAWRLVLRHDPGRLEAHERIGALYLALGRGADARAHYLRALAELKAAGLVREAAIVGAHLATLGEQDTGGGSAGPRAPASPIAPAPAAPRPSAEPPADPAEPPDADATAFAAERFQDARLFHHYNMESKARESLEQLLMIEPDHLEGRRLLVEVCRALGDQRAASEHFQVVTRLLREQAGPPPPADPGPVPVPQPGPPCVDRDLLVEGELAPERDPATASHPDGEAAPPAASDAVLQLDLGLDPAPRPVAAPPSPGAPGTVSPPAGELSEDALLAGLRREIGRVTAGEDAETRYNLGFALREMGLLDEAIVEFQQAARDAQHFYACASMLGLCFRESGFPQLAVRWLERGLAVPGRSEDEYRGMRYELALALEAAGDRPGAIAHLTELYGEDAGYRDVAERLRRLLALERDGAAQAGSPRR